VQLALAPLWSQPPGALLRHSTARQIKATLQSLVCSLMDRWVSMNPTIIKKKLSEATAGYQSYVGAAGLSKRMSVSQQSLKTCNWEK